MNRRLISERITGTLNRSGWILGDCIWLAFLTGFILGGAFGFWLGWEGTE